MKLKLGVLISGAGTNLQAILDAIDAGQLSATVALVLSNQERAFGLERAKQHRIPTAVIRHQEGATREAFDDLLTGQLEAAGVELVVLAGFMRVLGKKFVDRYRGRIMNIHPALLPSFPGTGAIEAAWKSGAKVTGVTVHFVDEGVDTGPIILQQTVPIEAEEGLELLTERIHQLEHQLYPEAIRLYAEGRLKIVGRKVEIKEGAIKCVQPLSC